MEHEYGLKAPQLEDGSYLLNEVSLNKEQTDGIKQDMVLVASVVKNTARIMRADFLVSGLVTMFSIGTVVLAFNGVSMTSLLLILVAIQISSMVQRNYFKKKLRASAGEISNLTSVPIVASAVRHFWAAKSEDQRYVSCMDLMQRKDVPLANNGAYRLVLDSAVEDNYVLRVVQKPASQETTG